VANSTSGESVISRVVRILAAFSDESPALSVREVARIAGLPVSTAHRLASELEAEALLVRDEGGRLRHGHRMWELASRGSSASRLREAALPLMEDLLAATGKNVSLGVLEGTDVLYLERLAPDDHTVDITRVAGRLPLHGSSAGLVFMAFAADDDRERFLSRRLPKLTPDTITSPDKLRALLTGARRDGYLAMQGIIVEESSGISVPIFTEGQRVIATLTLIAPRGEEELETSVPQLKLASRAISRRLGYEPATGRARRFSTP